MTKSEQLLKNLAFALDNAFISTWQTTSSWQKELDDALEYCKLIDERSTFSVDTQTKINDAIDFASKVAKKYAKPS